VLLLAAIAYRVLVTAILKQHGPHSRLRAAIGRDTKGKLSIALYAAAVPLAFLNPLIADAVYVAVALIWLVPDRRIESNVHG
jgi:uncharacterized membrane protein